MEANEQVLEQLRLNNLSSIFSQPELPVSKSRCIDEINPPNTSSLTSSLLSTSNSSSSQLLKSSSNLQTDTCDQLINIQLENITDSDKKNKIEINEIDELEEIEGESDDEGDISFGTNHIPMQQKKIPGIPSLSQYFNDLNKDFNDLNKEIHEIHPLVGTNLRQSHQEELSSLTPSSIKRREALIATIVKCGYKPLDAEALYLKHDGLVPSIVKDIHLSIFSTNNEINHHTLDEATETFNCMFQNQLKGTPLNSQSQNINIYTTGVLDYISTICSENKLSSEDTEFVTNHFLEHKPLTIDGFGTSKIHIKNVVLLRALFPQFDLKFIIIVFYELGQQDFNKCVDILSTTKFEDH